MVRLIPKALYRRSKSVLILPCRLVICCSARVVLIFAGHLMSECEGERNDEFIRIKEDAVSKLRQSLSLDTIILFLKCL